MLQRRTGICDLVVQTSKALRHLTWIILSLTAVGCETHAEAAAAHYEAAKEELVRASTPEAVDAASRKVNLLCN